MTLVLGELFVGLARHDQHRLLLGLVSEAVGEILGKDVATQDATFAELGLDESALDTLADRLGLAALAPDGTPARVAELLWSRLAGLPDGGERTEPDDEWQTNELRLPAYLERVGLQVPQEPTLEALRALHWAHVTTIGFHNLDVLLKRPISLELPDIQRKLVQSRAGGTCVEHNLLFAAVLQRLGFTVTRLTGRPRLGRPAVLPKTHAALLVQLGRDRWLVDVGLGGQCPTEPVAIGTGAVAGHKPWRWRVADEDGAFVLEMENHDHWVALYSFDLHPQRLVDYQVSSYYSTTYPGIPFAHTLVAQRIRAHERHVATGDQYTRTTATGERVTRPLDAETLTEVFGLPGADVAAVLRAQD